MYKTLIMYSLILSVVLFGGCRKDIDAHYARPTYLLGSTYEFLEKRGDFTLFLDAVDRSGFKTGLNGSGLFTVFAPSDVAVKAYLAEIGKTSLTELTPEELELLVGYHIVEFSYRPEDFLGFTKTASSLEPEIADGYAHRFKTLAREEVRERKNPALGNLVDVFQQEKFLPIISTTLLKHKRSPDYEADYKFFFPDVNWKGDKDQFYVAGAAVLESGIPVDNGYVYIVDKVVAPLKTVYDAFDDKPDYSLFRELYDRFASFEYDQEATSSYAALGDSLFVMRHYLGPAATSADLPDISDEWTVSPGQSDFEARMRRTFNSYVPNNASLEAFCNEYFADEKDPKKIPLLPLFYLLSSHIPYGQEIIMPSDFSKGVEGLFGEKWILGQGDLFDQEFCSNGLFYGIKKVLEPAIFSMITEPLFKYERFSLLASLFHKTQNILPLVDVDRNYSLLLLSNTNLKNTYGYMLDYNGNPADLDILGSRIKVFRYADYKDSDKAIVEINFPAQLNVVQSQVVDGLIEYETGERKFFATRQPFTYLYQNDGGLFYEDTARVKIVENGRFPIYEYENGTGKGLVIEVENLLERNTVNVANQLRKTNPKFYKELLRANLIKLENLDENGGIIEGPDSWKNTKFITDHWLNGERCMVFAPTDAAFDESVIPTDSAALHKYLKSHFISVDQNGVDQYTLPNLGPEREYDTKANITLAKFETLTLTYKDSKTLTVTDTKAVATSTDGKIPFFASDGVIFGIIDMKKP